MTQPNNHHAGPRPLQRGWDESPAATSSSPRRGPHTEEPGDQGQNAGGLPGTESHETSSRAASGPWPQPSDGAALPFDLPWALPHQMSTPDPADITRSMVNTPEPLDTPHVRASSADGPSPSAPAVPTQLPVPPPAPLSVLFPGPTSAFEPPPGPAPYSTQGRIGPLPSTGTADALSHDLLVRSRSDRPTEGWRAAVYSATGGRFNPGLSRDEQQRRLWLNRIRAQLPGCHEITVASMKGGVGKTTMSTLLGLVLAEYRGDRVIALDANPDAGTLADRVLGHSVNYTVRDLLNNLDTIESLTDIARYTNLAGRLQVLASEQDPAMSESFNRNEYEAVTQVLRRFYNIIITDSGTGLLHSAMHGALASAKTLVIVGAPTVDAASRASKTLDWLMAHGHRDLVANAVVALSCDRFSRDIDRDAVSAHFESRCRAVVQLPMDPHLATGGHIQLGHLRPATRDAALALGAAVADAFGMSRVPSGQELSADTEAPAHVRTPG